LNVNRNTRQTGELRFAFGHNWNNFLSVVNAERIDEAVTSIRRIFSTDSMSGNTFLDAGCGSGLFSLAARRLGAEVISFDYDNLSVQAAKLLKSKFAPADHSWSISHGSLLDSNYIRALPEFDYVYSWGVLHHTGDMWRALDLLAEKVTKSGLICISIYNQQTLMTPFWRLVKKSYNRSPFFMKKIMAYAFYSYFASGLFVLDLIRRRNPVDRHKGIGRRGMSGFTDIVDWIGGMPFEVAKPEDVFRFMRDRGFNLVELKTCAGKHGCNEFVFRNDR